MVRSLIEWAAIVAIAIVGLFVPAIGLAVRITFFVVAALWLVALCLRRIRGRRDGGVP